MRAIVSIRRVSLFGFLFSQFALVALAAGAAGGSTAPLQTFAEAVFNTGPGFSYGLTVQGSDVVPVHLLDVSGAVIGGGANRRLNGARPARVSSARATTAIAATRTGSVKRPAATSVRVASRRTSTGTVEVTAGPPP